MQYLHGKLQNLHGKLQNLHPLRPQTMQNLHPFRGINAPTVESCYRTFWGYASKEPNVQKTTVFGAVYVPAHLNLQDRSTNGRF